jgi:hypothetical protein
MCIIGYLNLTLLSHQFNLQLSLESSHSPKLPMQKVMHSPSKLSRSPQPFSCKKSDAMYIKANAGNAVPSSQMQKIQLLFVKSR